MYSSLLIKWGAESNHEGFKELGVEIAGYTTVVGSALQEQSASLSADAQSDLVKVKTHIAQFERYDRNFQQSIV
jgi:hypothetical protein